MREEEGSCSERGRIAGTSFDDRMRCSTVFYVRRSGFLGVARTLSCGLKTRMKPSFYLFISLKNNIYSR